MVAWNRGVGITSIPGADCCLWWLAKSTSACDTAAMTALSRALARWDPARVAAGALGLAVLLLPAAYAVSLGSSNATAGGVISAVGLVGIAGSGLLYAWRLGAGGIVD